MCIRDSLMVSFRQYFPKREDGDNWIADPFNEDNFKTAKLSIHEKEKLIEISTDSSLKSDFKKKTLGNFWASISEEYMN